MPIVPASKAESDDLVYGTIRPSPQDRDTDKIKKQLQDIESDRQRKRNSSQKAPPHEEGFSSPVFDDEHGCWKIQSSTESKILKIWDEKREIWRERYDKSSMFNPECGNILAGVKTDWRSTQRC